MKKLLATFILLGSLTNVLPQSKRIGVFRFQRRNKAHVARIIIRASPFDTSKHKKSYDEKTGNNLIDGRVAYGAEGTPEAEIASIRFYFDGTEIKCPKWLYADCYDPNFNDGLFKLRFSRDGRGILVTMGGSDGAGGYGVVWILKKDGEHSRY